MPMTDCIISSATVTSFAAAAKAFCWAISVVSSSSSETPLTLFRRLSTWLTTTSWAVALFSASCTSTPSRDTSRW